MEQDQQQEQKIIENKFKLNQRVWYVVYGKAYASSQAYEYSFGCSTVGRITAASTAKYDASTSDWLKKCGRSTTEVLYDLISPYHPGETMYLPFSEAEIFSSNTEASTFLLDHMESIYQAEVKEINQKYEKLREEAAKLSTLIELKGMGGAP